MEIWLGNVDEKLWTEHELIHFLYKSKQADSTIEVSLLPEGSSASTLGLYKILDDFCDATNYPKSKITIKTGNMIEYHPEYTVERRPDAWYEIGAIQEWLEDKSIDSGISPTKHFSNFVSRNNWYRLWIATILNKYHSDKTIQTYHYNLKQENYNPNKYSGIDDLLKRECELVPEAVKFLQTCPRTIDLDYLTNLENSKGSVYQHENSYYPIQHPSNLNLLQYYRDIFVDVICEPNTSGWCFLATEKLWRCIVARRPFIVVSNPWFLNNLQQLGFKTFNQWWKEDYDEIGDTVERIRSIELLLDVISKWSLVELTTKLQEMQLVLDHNYNVFMSLDHDKLRKVFI